MPEIYTRSLNQQATYWGPGTPDGEGGFSSGPPQLMACRYEQRTTQYLDQQGQRQVGSAVCYCGIEVSVGGYIIEGDYTAANEPRAVRALLIKDVKKSPSLGASHVLIKAVL